MRNPADIDLEEIFPEERDQLTVLLGYLHKRGLYADAVRYALKEAGL